MGILQEGVGGKLHVFMSSLPKLGLHALTPRQATAPSDNQQKQTALLPQHKGYRQMAENAAEHQVPSHSSATPFSPPAPPPLFCPLHTVVLR